MQQLAPLQAHRQAQQKTTRQRQAPQPPPEDQQLMLLEAPLARKPDMWARSKVHNFGSGLRY